MTAGRRALVAGLGVAAAVAIAFRRHVRRSTGRHVPGGILVADPRLYDALGHGLVLRSLFRGIAADVARIAPAGARVLEVGCGPGRLSTLLASEGMEVMGLDLDPEMIDRARGNAARSRWNADTRSPAFLVGDVAAMSFHDAAFDVVISTLSMHHWDDPAAGLREIARVLRPGGRALIWDFRRGRIPFHGSLPDPTTHAEATPLRVEGSAPWRWPWRITLLTRVELARG